MNVSRGPSYEIRTVADYNDYYRLRNVDLTVYANYRIPAYLLNVLPADTKAKILDIGCGYGHLLQALRRKGYANACGIEVSEPAVVHCLDQGLNVVKISDLLEYCVLSKAKYDFIIMSHVLEHLDKSKIIQGLELIRNHLLGPDGKLVVMVPNAQSHTGCYWAYEDFTHQTLFTAGSLYYVLKAAGFSEVVFLDPDGLDGTKPMFLWIRKILLFAYKTNLWFWNLATGSSFHRPSPQIFTYELKALAK